MKIVKKSVFDVMAFLQENSAAPVPVHIRSIDFDSASGSYTIALLPAGLSYPDPTTPTRIKAGVVDDAAPTGPTVGTVLTDYNHCRAYLVFKNVGGVVVPAGNCTVTLWHRGIKGMEDATGAPAVGPWVQGPVLTGIFSYQEIVDVMLYHREVYLQLTTHVGALITTVEVFVAGIEDGAYQQPLAITPGGLLEVHLKDVKIEGGNLEVEIEAKPDDPNEKADSVINESTVDHTTPQTGNLSPPVMPIHIDSAGRSTVVGYVPEAGVMENDFPVKMAGVDHAGTRASLLTALGVPNAELVYTAVKPGIEGNAITIQYVAAILATPVVSVVGNAIVFTGNIAATIDAIVVLNAINADPYARMLVNAELAPANTGLGHIIVYGPAPLINGLNHSHVNIPDVNAAGETLVRQGTAANLNMTEASASDIETNTQAVADTTGAPAAALPSKAVQVEVNDGTGKGIAPLGDSLGRLQIVMATGYTMVTATMDCTAAEAPGNAVYNLAGVARKANAGALATTPGIGTILSKPDATHAVVVFGGENAANSGCIAGAAYYLDKVDGLLTTTVPTAVGGFNRTQVMGRANAAGVLIVHPEQDYPAP